MDRRLLHVASMRGMVAWTLLLALSGCSFSIPLESLSTVDSGRVATTDGDLVAMPEQSAAELELADEGGRWMAPPRLSPAPLVFVPDDQRGRARDRGLEDVERELRTPLRGGREGGWLWIETEAGRVIGVPDRAVQAIEVTDVAAKRRGMAAIIVSGSLAVIAAAILIGYGVSQTEFY